MCVFRYRLCIISYTNSYWIEDCVTTLWLILIYVIQLFPLTVFILFDLSIMCIITLFVTPSIHSSIYFSVLNRSPAHHANSRCWWKNCWYLITRGSWHRQLFIMLCCNQFHIPSPESLSTRSRSMWCHYYTS